ncbi:hypothetical protein BDBG_18091 [Blastomyces gilchristii SLH14081]|uniref:Uncharacterized protein n=1 Tax=Blastomyces gilchristii (strain SLH14081) TaxID=559298 RepID=A0A179V7B4_BLAGS|nr:uncharacterized protein BDBG_18091 [Blastomyces gilchristii SLH14081]OAT14572.1 hypothetical protein BDBG_18091 [Blastomyces gilchristii SLH14081]
MNQKAASEAFELNDMIMKEQSDKFNVYEDSVEGISEMSGNAESSMSEKTHMRLEIARLQHEVEQMKISRDDSAGDEMKADLAEYLQ